MALNTCELWSNDIKIAFFQKIVLRLGAFPDPVYDTFWVTLDARRVSDFKHFHYLAFSLSPVPLAKFWLSAKTGHGFWSSIQRYLCHTKSSFENFWWRHCMWFVVYPPSPVKNSGYTYGFRLDIRTWLAFPPIIINTIIVIAKQWLVLLRTITVHIFRSKQIFELFRARFWLQITFWIRACRPVYNFCSNGIKTIRAKWLNDYLHLQIETVIHKILGVSLVSPETMKLVSNILYYFSKFVNQINQVNKVCHQTALMNNFWNERSRMTRFFT